MNKDRAQGGNGGTNSKAQWAHTHKAHPSKARRGKIFQE
jgi:hypothetical protein